MNRSLLIEKPFDALEEHLETVAGLSFSNVTDSCDDLLDDGIDDNDDWCFKALVGRHWTKRVGREPLPFKSRTTWLCGLPLLRDQIHLRWLNVQFIHVYVTGQKLNSGSNSQFPLPPYSPNSWIIILELGDKRNLTKFEPENNFDL